MTSVRAGRPSSQSGFGPLGVDVRVSLRRGLGGAVAVLLALTGLGLGGGVAHASSGSSFVSLINSSRAAAGLRPYVVRSDLTAVAQAQAQRMASSGKLYHNPHLATDVKNFAWVGENVGYGPGVVALHNAFMNSSGHRANILDHQFTEVGVGLVQVGATLWVAEVFRQPSGGASRPKPKPVAKPAPKAKPKPAAVHVVPRRAPAVHRVPVRPVTVQTARSSADSLPPHVVCSANPAVARQIRDLAGADRSARLVDQTQHLLLGYQCGAHLPLTGVFDRGTLRSLSG